MSTSNTQAILLQPDNHNKKYEALFLEIDSGQIKLPMFQREFVWEKEQTTKLLDSILKGFPIGTFIFWRTREELRSYKEVGNHTLPETPKGDYVQYILDGQQRITSLYAVRKGIRITKDGEEIDYRNIYIDLDFEANTDEQIVVHEMLEGRRYLSVHRLLTWQLTDLMSEFPDRETLKQIEEYKKRLTSYDFSTITIKDYPIDIACEIFTRINTGGKALTVFEIMVAKTYDESRLFDLADQYEILRDGDDDDATRSLASAKFETIPAAIIMQCVAALTQRAVRSKDILKIRRDEFIGNWPRMKDALFTAIDFARTELRVPVSQLLPYPSLLVPFTYFFDKSGNRKPEPNQVKLLEQFFYWVGLTSRYSSGAEGKLVEDLSRMDQILKGEPPSYSDLGVRAKTIEETWFSAGSAYCKAIVCLLAYQQPKSFDTNGIVVLDNSNLKIATSRNYHHFFPKAFLQKQDGGHEPNLIANITLIDGYGNKHRIGKKAPATYVKKFMSANDKIGESLKSHLIEDASDFGVLDNDYPTFISRRSRAIADALNMKLLVAPKRRRPDEEH